MSVFVSFSYIETFINSLKLNLSRLIVYAENADVKLQREVAEKLANEVVHYTSIALFLNNKITLARFIVNCIKTVSTIIYFILL